MKSRICVSLVISMIAGILASCAPAPTAAPTGEPSGSATVATPAESTPPLGAPIPLKVAFTNFASNSPVYFALQEGYFADVGLEVELVTFASGSEIYPALAAGQVDVVLWTLSAALFNAAAQGVHMSYVADKGYSDPDSCPADAWLASNQALAAGLSDYSTLKGRKLTLTPGSISEYAIDLMLAEAGLESTDLEFVQITDNAAKVEALRNGSVDLVPLGEPWITYAVSQGAAQVWRRYSDILPRQSIAFVVYGPNILDGNHEAGVRFMTAYLRGVDQFNEGKTERNIELISEFTKISPDDLNAACWNSFKPDGTADVEGLLAYQQWLVSKGILENALPLDQFWTDEFVKEALVRLGR